ncbi:MAG TPA: ketoreductase, partial [Ruminococcaceae bacterium]|nr:ketoreductase [Oscillospiraceae bacterium]
MEKKIILVTGASSGIGTETAMTLAKQGHKVIVHGRNLETTKTVWEAIKKENSDTDMIVCDLSLLTDIKRLSDELHEKYDHIDVLINNAGGQFTDERKETTEGHELTFAINTLAPFLLTTLLMDLLEKSESGRVVTVSSESYCQAGDPIINDIELKDNYSMMKSYGQSKLFVLWIMRMFAKNYKDSKVTFNTCEPGSVSTNLARESGKMDWFKEMMEKHQEYMWSVEKGAATSIYLATVPEVSEVSGKFYGD